MLLRAQTPRNRWLRLVRQAPSTSTVALLGAGAGLAWARGRLQDTQTRFGPQQQALRCGDLLIVAEVDQADIERVENQIAERHPQVLVLGSDPGGSPPFP